MFPKIERTEQYNSTAIRVIWAMPNEFSDIVNEWYVEYRLDEEGEIYHAVKVDRKGNLINLLISCNLFIFNLSFVTCVM